MLIYGLCLIAADEYQQANQEKRFFGITSPVWTAILAILASLLIMVERIRVWELFYV